MRVHGPDQTKELLKPKSFIAFDRAVKEKVFFGLRKFSDAHYPTSSAPSRDFLCSDWLATLHNIFSLAEGAIDEKLSRQSLICCIILALRSSHHLQRVLILGTFDSVREVLVNRQKF